MSAFVQNPLIWDLHYQRKKAHLQIPDENVVRFLKKVQTQIKPPAYFLDIGTGSGRHKNLAKSMGFFSLGMDTSLQALKNSQEHVVQASVEKIPFASSTFHVVLVWGVLHYLERELALKAVHEIYRILKPKGHVAFTIRADADTHLKHTSQKGDLQNASYVLYTKQESAHLLKIFSKKQYGFLLRQPVGSPFQLAHHIWECIK